MTEIEAGKSLTELLAGYERLASKLYYPMPAKYYEAVALAIMALGANKKESSA